MLALLIGAATVGLVLVFGLVLAVYFALRPSEQNGRNAGGGSGSPDNTATTTAATAVDERDALAAEVMPSVDEAASHPGPVSANATGTPSGLPDPTRVGPARVPTGFPHTPEGAMAQLAAIDQVAIQSGSLGTAAVVIRNWSVPGGPTEQTWSGTQAVATLLTSAQTAGSSQLAIVMTPLMGLVKGTVGPDFVIPCIDFELDVTLSQTARGAVADCQRMVWQQDSRRGRWMIGAGSEPATPPSVWPGTDLAISVGYRYLRKAG
jgi:hypothetical protein